MSGGVSKSLADLANYYYGQEVVKGLAKPPGLPSIFKPMARKAFIARKAPLAHENAAIGSSATGDKWLMRKKPQSAVSAMVGSNERSAAAARGLSRNDAARAASARQPNPAVSERNRLISAQQEGARRQQAFGSATTRKTPFGRWDI